MSVAEIESTSVEDQLDAKEKIWSASSRNEASVKSREWHNDVLSERKRKPLFFLAIFFLLIVLTEVLEHDGGICSRTANWANV